MANLSPNASQLVAKGTGEETLSLSGWGTNESRLARSFKYRLYDAGGVQQDTLIVTQAGTELGIRVNGNASKPATSGSSSVTVTFNGYSNGRYMRFQNDNSSSQLVVSSAKEYSASQTGADFSSNFTEVSSFGRWYEFSVTVSIPANASADTYSFSVYTSDDTQTSKYVTYSVVVTESGGGGGDDYDPVSSIRVTPQSVVLSTDSSASNHTQQLSVVILPETADQGVQYFSDDANVATVSRYGGFVTGVSEGTCTITARADGDYNKWDTCAVSVFTPSWITVDAINIPGSVSDPSGSGAIRANNIDPDTLQYHYTSGSAPDWVNSVTIDTSSYPYYLNVSVDGNGTIDNPGSTRSFSLYVTAEDEFGETVSSGSVVVTQSAPSTDDRPCTGMNINLYDTTIETPNNLGEYTCEYVPPATTQHRHTWYLTYRDGSANPSSVSELGSSVPSNIAEIVTDDGEHSEYGQTCLIRVNTGATTRQNLRVWVINYYNFSARDYVDVDAIYVEPNGNISANPNPVTVGWNDTRQDNTNGAPVITLTNMRDAVTNLTVTHTGSITTASVGGSGNTGYVITEFPVNPTPSVQIELGTVTLSGYDAGGTMRSYTISYKQSAQPAVEKNDIQVLALSATLNSGEFDIVAIGNLINNKFASTTFNNITCSVVGYNSIDPNTIISQTSMRLDSESITMTASETTREITFTGRMSATSQSSSHHVDEFTVTMSAYSVADGETVSKTREGLDGTDDPNDYYDDGTN